MNIDFPFAFDAHGRTATTDDADHIRDMMEQLLVHLAGRAREPARFRQRPLQMVFAPNSAELAAALAVHHRKRPLQRYLGDLIDLQKLEVTAEDATLTVIVSYVIRAHPASRRPHTFVSERMR